MPASTFSLWSSMCCDVRLHEEIKHALPWSGWTAAFSVSRNELNLFAGQRKAPVDAVSTALRLYELFKHSARSDWICCYLSSCSNTHPCSHGYGKDCETSTGSNTNTAKIYGRIHSRGGSSENNHSSCASNCISVAHRAMCCLCPRAPGHVLSAVACSATQGKPAYIPQQLFRGIQPALVLNPPCSFHMNLWLLFKWQNFVLFCFWWYAWGESCLTQTLR